MREDGEAVGDPQRRQHRQPADAPVGDPSAAVEERREGDGTGGGALGREPAVVEEIGEAEVAAITARRNMRSDRIH